MRSQFVVLMSVLFLLVLCSSRIEAATISGYVIDDETQVSILNAEITFTLMPDFHQRTTILTDENGYFETELFAGEYQVYAQMQGGSYAPVKYVPEVLGDIFCTNYSCVNELSIGTPLVVQNSTTIDNLNFALSKTATISGQITDENTGSLIKSVFAYAEEVNTGFYSRSDETVGDFQIDGLFPGTYKLRTETYVGDYIQEYYDGHAFLAEPATFTPLVIEAAQQYTVDFELEPKSVVAGVVTDEQSGEPMRNVQVKLYDLENEYVADAKTDADGNYTLYHVPGSYKLIFDSDYYVSELHNDLGCSSYKYKFGPHSCLDAENFTAVELASGSPALVDAQLNRGSYLSGTVTDEETGLPLQGINYRLFHESGLEISYHSSYTGDLGLFSIRLIPPGRYYLILDVRDNSAYIDEAYDDVPCLGHRCDLQSDATALVFPEQSGIDLDISLAKGLSISGMITSQQTGLPLTNVSVDAYSKDWSSVAGSGYTSSEDGNYVINGLLPGEYYLVFYPWGLDSGYSQQLHDNIVCPAWACDYSSLATLVTLEEDGNLVIDAQLIEKIIFEDNFE